MPRQFFLGWLAALSANRLLAAAMAVLDDARLFAILGGGLVMPLFYVQLTLPAYLSRLQELTRSHTPY